jgi:putative sterol carrier protein
VQGVLRRDAQGVPARLAKGLSCLYQFDLSGEGGGKYFVEVRDGRLDVGEGERPNPDVTLVAAAVDYIDIAEGRKSALFALARGKFKIKGNNGPGHEAREDLRALRVPPSGGRAGTCASVGLAARGAT